MVLYASPLNPYIPLYGEAVSLLQFFYRGIGFVYVVLIVFILLLVFSFNKYTFLFFLFKRCVVHSIHVALAFPLVVSRLGLETLNKPSLKDNNRHPPRQVIMLYLDYNNKTEIMRTAPHPWSSVGLKYYSLKTFWRMSPKGAVLRAQCVPVSTRKMCSSA